MNICHFKDIKDVAQTLWLYLGATGDLPPPKEQNATFTFVD